MSVIYAAALRTARLQAVLDALDADAGACFMEIGTSGFGSVLATIVMNDPAAVVSGDTLTFGGMPRSDTNADASGTAAEARIKDNSGDIIISGLTVGTSGTNVVLSSVGITAGDTVTITSAVITHPSS